jgi:hypothetical protein
MDKLGWDRMVGEKYQGLEYMELEFKMEFGYATSSVTM